MTPKNFQDSEENTEPQTESSHKLYKKLLDKIGTDSLKIKQQQQDFKSDSSTLINFHHSQKNIDLSKYEQYNIQREYVNLNEDENNDSLNILEDPQKLFSQATEFDC